MSVAMAMTNTQLLCTFGRRTPAARYGEALGIRDTLETLPVARNHTEKGSEDVMVCLAAVKTQPTGL